MIAGEALAAFARTTEGASRLAARWLELWVGKGWVPMEVGGRLAALETSPTPEAALIAEELALGGYEAGQASPGVLQVVTHLDGPAFVEARALAQLERFTRGVVDEDALLPLLAPGLLGPGEPRLPDVVARLLGGLGHPLAFTPEHTDALDALLDRLRESSARLEANSPAAAVAQRVIACCPALRPVEVIALSEPGRAASAQPAHRLPEPEALTPLLSALDERRSIEVAWTFPMLAGVVEQARSVAGLTGWIELRRTPDVPSAISPELIRRVEQHIAPETSARWAAWLGTSESSPKREEPTIRQRLVRALREGTPLSRDELCAQWSQLGLSTVLFDSPGGPGLLTERGTLSHPWREWPAPAELVPTHPLELPEAERVAWQERLCALRLSSPLNQVFREVTRPSGGEPSRSRLDRWRGARLTEIGLELLRARGWFPTSSPVEVPPELHLGDGIARLRLERVAGGPPAVLGVEFWKGSARSTLSTVQPRLFSEAWRDVDEAISLGMTEPSWVPCRERGQLIQALMPKLKAKLTQVRVEADHVACVSSRGPVRLSLHDALGAPGLPSLGQARSLGVPLLPFEDDGGVAAVLVGRLWSLGEGDRGRESSS